jgi:RNA polymerase sigma-70 factor (ECF subfamily)
MTMTKKLLSGSSLRAANVKISHDNFTDKSPRLDKIVEDGDSLNGLKKIINCQEQKIVVQMRDVEQYEFAEIAQILQMNETAIQ